MYDPEGELKMIVKGRHLIKGLPEQIEISDIDVFEAIKELVFEMVDSIKGVLEVTPPELVGDIYNNGIVLTGGGALLGGLDKLISASTGIPCVIADEPIACVAKGTGMAFEMIDKLLDGFESISLYKY